MAPFVLARRNVYIFPTRQGLFFAITLLIILLGAINYNNSLGYLLTFLLAAIAIVAILHTYRNLLHLKVRIGTIEPVFQGGDIHIPVILDNHQQPARFNVRLQFPQQTPVNTDIPAGQRHIVQLSKPAGLRGRQPIGRFILSTTFPLGLFRAWSHVVLDEHYLVYPAPARDGRLPVTSRYMASLYGDQGVGSDDFAGLRGFRNGDSLKHIHWKALARQQGLLTKQFGGDRSEQLWLDWRMLEGARQRATPVAIVPLGNRGGATWPGIRFVVTRSNYRSRSWQATSTTVLHGTGAFRVTTWISSAFYSACRWPI